MCASGKTRASLRNLDAAVLIGRCPQGYGCGPAWHACNRDFDELGIGLSRRIISLFIENAEIYRPRLRSVELPVQLAAAAPLNGEVMMGVGAPVVNDHEDLVGLRIVTHGAEGIRSRDGGRYDRGDQNQGREKAPVPSPSACKHVRTYRLTAPVVLRLTHTPGHDGIYESAVLQRSRATGALRSIIIEVERLASVSAEGRGSAGQVCVVDSEGVTWSEPMSLPAPS